MNADSQTKYGWMRTASTTPVKTSDPAAKRTCRSSDQGAFSSRSNGRPAFFQASKPPVTLMTSAKPRAFSFFWASADRRPVRHIT